MNWIVSSVIGADMRRTDIIFLVCAFGFALLITVRSITLAIPLLPGRTFPDQPTMGAAGQARDVDMQRLRALLKQRALSDHEAEFYEPVD